MSSGGPAVDPMVLESLTKIRQDLDALSESEQERNQLDQMKDLVRRSVLQKDQQANQLLDDITARNFALYYHQGLVTFPLDPNDFRIDQKQTDPTRVTWDMVDPRAEYWKQKQLYEQKLKEQKQQQQIFITSSGQPTLVKTEWVVAAPEPFLSSQDLCRLNPSSFSSLPRQSTVSSWTMVEVVNQWFDNRHTALASLHSQHPLWHVRDLIDLVQEYDQPTPSNHLEWFKEILERFPSTGRRTTTNEETHGNMTHGQITNKTVIDTTQTWKLNNLRAMGAMKSPVGIGRRSLPITSNDLLKYIRDQITVFADLPYQNFPRQELEFHLEQANARCDTDRRFRLTSDRFYNEIPNKPIVVQQTCLSFIIDDNIEFELIETKTRITSTSQNAFISA